MYENVLLYKINFINIQMYFVTCFTIRFSVACTKKCNFLFIFFKAIFSCRKSQESLSQTLSIKYTDTLSLSHSHTITHTLTHKHTHKQAHKRTHTHSLTHTHIHSRTHTHSHTHIHNLFGKICVF